MLKTQFTICICSSFFLLPTNFDKGESGLSASKSHIKEKVPIATLRAPKTPLNEQGMQFVRCYIKKSSRNLVTIKRKSKIPFNIIDSVFRRYGLPLELKYLAVIESELEPSALSPVGALGPWQLMPATAHILGLKMTSKYDERMNYYKSTRAAARYLKDLYGEFGDWLLVVAAYNGGPGPVYTAINRSDSRNFWILQRYLPAETRLHVKRFIATHYYFEGRGSMTTLTRAETVQYTKKVNAFVVFHTAEKPSLNELPKKEKESTEEKFKRIMKDSEESLHKSNELLEEIN